MWPFTSKKRAAGSEAGKLEAGVHRSPGLGELSGVVRDEKVQAVLDLGASSTENIEALAGWCDDFVVQDCFRSAGSAEGERTAAFRFGSGSEIDLPEPDQLFDIVLLWDLLHYFDREEARAFASRLAERTVPGGLLLAHASAVTPIPPTPIQFKIVESDRLEYVCGEARVAAPEMTTRAIEQLMQSFKPLRVLQLRNGLQELIFQRKESAPSAAGAASPAEPADS
ncbi:MAG: class I SAM-dependent methyltransferase [Acidobacteriota bacterium]